MDKKGTELKEFAKDFNNYIVDSSVPLPSAQDWLFLKQKIDNVTCGDAKLLGRSLWRIHNKVYDFSTFHSHPGGYSLINMTKNTDITELFESCHVNIAKAESLLEKYYVADCPKGSNRNSAMFTFEKSGFYKTLRTKVYEKLSKVGSLGYLHRSTVVHDALLIVFLSLWITLLTSDTQSPQFVVGLEVITGVVLGFLGVCAHTFYHLADSWRTYTLDLSGYSSYEWRISHVLSHHVFPNSVMDYEVMAFEPFLFFLPYSFKRRALQPLQSLLAVLLIFPLVWLASSLKRLGLVVQGKMAVRWEFFLAPLLLGLSLLLRLCLRPACSWPEGVWLVVSRFFIMQSVASWCFLLIGLNAAHHHPNIWHSGDDRALRDFRNAQGEVDWGVFQMVSVGYRPAVDNHWVVASVAFGQHILHHLFPALDPAALPGLYPVLLEVSKEFHLLHLLEEPVQVSATKQRSFTVWESFVGMFRQSLRHECQ